MAPVDNNSEHTRRGSVPQGSLLWRFGVNTLAYGYAQAATIVVQILQVPLFLHFWGVERYGEWIVLAGIPLMLTVLDLGVTQASASKSSMEGGRGDWEIARNTLQTARVYTVGISLLLFIAVVISTAFLNWSQVLHLATVDRQTSSTVLIILTAALAMNMQGGYLDAWMRAYNEPALSGFIIANSRVAETVATAVCLLAGLGFVGVAIGYLVAAVVMRGVHAFVALSRSTLELSSFGSFDANGLRSIVKPASGFIAISLTQALTIQGGIQVLNQMASASVVVAFTATRTLVRLIFQLGVVLNNSLRVEFSRLVGSGRRAEALSFVRRVWMVSLGVGCIAYLGLVLVGPEFVSIWSSRKVSVSHSFVALVGFHAVLGLFWYVPASLEMAENRHAHFAMFYGGAAVLTILVWIAARSLLEPVLGAALLLAVPELIMASKVLYQSFALNRMLGPFRFASR